MFKVEDIIKWTKGKLLYGDKNLIPSGISIDSRTIKKGEIFIAIKGERFDGHDFVVETLKKGALGAIVSNVGTFGNSKLAAQKVIIVVDDTVRALGQIAYNYRTGFKNLQVIAVTGSNGKTTTKELIATALSGSFNVLKSKASFNNFIGLPLTLLELTSEHTACVLEMGMSRLGEIKTLSSIAKPNIGVITNIGPSHLAFLKNLKNIFIAKSELLRNLPEEGVAILNKDDAFLKRINFKAPCRKLYFGIESKCDFQARDLLYKGKGWEFCLNGKNIFQIPLLGRHNIYNALAAIAVASTLGAGLDAIANALKNFELTCTGRMAYLNLNGLDILDDTYNSNPVSMRYAVQALSGCEAAGKRIIITGDMLELGSSARAFHENIGKLIAESNVDRLITLGNFSKFVATNAARHGMPRKCVFHVDSHRQAAELLKRISNPGDAVLVKGSRDMGMEKVIQYLKSKG